MSPLYTCTAVNLYKCYNKSCPLYTLVQQRVCTNVTIKSCCYKQRVPQSDRLLTLMLYASWLLLPRVLVCLKSSNHIIHVDNLLGIQTLASAQLLQENHHQHLKVLTRCSIQTFANAQLLPMNRHQHLKVLTCCAPCPELFSAHLCQNEPSGLLHTSTLATINMGHNIKQEKNEAKDKQFC